MIDKLIKEFPRALVISTFVFIALLVLKIATGVAIEFDSSLVVFYLYTTLYSFSLYYANAFLFIVLDEQFVHNRFSAQRIGLGLLFSFLISTVIIFSKNLYKNRINFIFHKMPIWMIGFLMIAFLQIILQLKDNLVEPFIYFQF